MKIWLLLLVLLPLQAQDWTKADTIRETANVVVTFADWCQTRQIAKHPLHTESYEVVKMPWYEQGVGWHDGYRQTFYREVGYEEMNPLLGKHPSIRKVDAYFTTSILGHYAISRWLGPRKRIWWQGMTFGYELAFVAHNSFQAKIAIKW